MDLRDSGGGKALVTGGSGVLGRHLTAALLGRGMQVRLFDLAPPPAGVQSLTSPADSPAGVGSVDLQTGPPQARKDPGSRTGPRPVAGSAKSHNRPPSGVGLVEFVKGDVSDSGAVSEACSGCSVVFHLAARMPQARLSEEGFRRVNVGGTRNVAEGCLRHNVPALIFASTIEIYGPQTDFPIREDSPKLFTGIYSRNKWECEQMLLSYREQYGLRVSMLRMPMILGPGFYHEKAVLEMMRRVRHGRMLPLPGGPEIPFTAVAASDAAAGFLAAFDRQEVDGEAFNLAAGRGEPTRELFSRFIRRVGSTSRILPLPRWLMSPVISAAVRLNVALPVVGTPVELLPFALTGGDFDISKAERILGYRPRKDCLAALVETYEWLAGQGVL